VVFRSGARLRLRPPRPVRRTPRLPRPTALLLVLVLIGALGAAYQFYLDGVPGSPRLPKLDDENPLGAAIAVRVPQGVEVRQRISLGKVNDFSPGTRVRTFNEPDPVMGLDPGTIHVSFEFGEYEPVPFDIVLALQGGARVSDNSGIRAFTWGIDGARVTVDGPHRRADDTDHVVLHVTQAHVRARKRRDFAVFDADRSSSSAALAFCGPRQRACGVANAFVRGLGAMRRPDTAPARLSPA
jgi:hypothetical protein